MEELLILRQHIEAKNYDEALAIIDELEEMSKEDKLNKIYSYAVILLIHLIKQQAEKRTTRSWEFSIYNSVTAIQRTNKIRKSGEYYANEEELKEILTEAFENAIRKTALEAFEGQYTDEELITKIDQNLIENKALKLILDK